MTAEKIKLTLSKIPLQSRADLYDFLNYHSYEDKLDTLFSQGNPKE